MPHRPSRPLIVAAVLCASMPAAAYAVDCTIASLKQNGGIVQMRTPTGEPDASQMPEMVYDRYDDKEKAYEQRMRMPDTSVYTIRITGCTRYRFLFEIENMAQAKTNNTMRQLLTLALSRIEQIPLKPDHDSALMPLSQALIDMLGDEGDQALLDNKWEDVKAAPLEMPCQMADRCLFDIPQEGTLRLSYQRDLP